MSTPLFRLQNPHNIRRIRRRRSPSHQLLHKSPHVNSPSPLTNTNGLHQPVGNMTTLPTSSPPSSLAQSAPLTSPSAPSTSSSPASPKPPPLSRSVACATNSGATLLPLPSTFVPPHNPSPSSSHPSLAPSVINMARAALSNRPSTDPGSSVSSPRGRSTPQTPPIPL